MKSKPAKFCLVTTAHRGVFGGVCVPSEAKSIRMTEARMCVYWDASMKGVLGLAVSGPGPNCRISPAVPALTLSDVTAVVECTEEAADAWRKAPWK